MNTTADNQQHILLVDDHPVNLRVLQSLLTVQGYRVSIASNGMLALHSMQKQSKITHHGA
jgi:CheY-like chemotaxis protein